MAKYSCSKEYPDVRVLFAKQDIPELLSFTLLYFPNVVHLDLSGLSDIVPNDFLDVIGYMKSVKSLNLDGCYQFSQYQIVKIFQMVKTVEKLSLVDCCKLAFTPAYCICSSVKFLKYVDFEPENIILEKRDWKRLIAIFSRLNLETNSVQHVVRTGEVSIHR